VQGQAAGSAEVAGEDADQLAVDGVEGQDAVVLAVRPYPAPAK
jgi:hypothetical protein